MKKLWPDWGDMYWDGDNALKRLRGPQQPRNWWFALTLALYALIKIGALVQVARGAWRPPPGARVWGLWINFNHEAILLLLCGVSAGMILGAIRYSRWLARRPPPALRG